MAILTTILRVAALPILLPLTVVNRSLKRKAKRRRKTPTLIIKL